LLTSQQQSPAATTFADSSLIAAVTAERGVATHDLGTARLTRKAPL
jgi:hypothetical protein